MVTRSNHVIPGPDLHCPLLWYFGNFRNIFLQNIDEDQINVLPSELGGPGTLPYGKSGPGDRITFIKRLDEGLRKQLPGQKSLISPKSYISIGWQNQIEGGPGLLVVNIIGNYCCTRVQFYA